MNRKIKQIIKQIRQDKVPKGHKKTKVGILPSEWEVKQLSEISDEITEKAGNYKYETLSISAGIGFVNQAEKFGKELSGRQYEKYIVLHNGDFSYNKGNSKKYPQGCIYQMKDREIAAVPNVFESFRFKEGVGDYFEQLFMYGFLNKQLSKKINHGVRDDGLLNLTSSDFYNSLLPFPSLPEQKKIAKILSTQDKLIELNQRKIEELKKLKKYYLSKMFPQKGSNVPEIRFKGFKRDWEQRMFGEVFEEYSEKNHEELPALTIIQGKGTILRENSDRNLIYDKSGLKNYKLVNKGDFILHLRSFESGLEVASSQGIVSPAYHIFHGKNVDSRFYYSFFRSKYFISVLLKPYVYGIRDGKSIDINGMKDVRIPYPSLKEQERIGEYFECLDFLIILHQRKLEEQKRYKKALMQLLLTGIVRV